MPHERPFPAPFSDMRYRTPSDCIGYAGGIPLVDKEQKLLGIRGEIVHGPKRVSLYG